jgi:hypothetical protein
LPTGTGYCTGRPGCPASHSGCTPSVCSRVQGLDGCGGITPEEGRRCGRRSGRIRSAGGGATRRRATVSGEPNGEPKGSQQRQTPGHAGRYRTLVSAARSSIRPRVATYSQPTGAPENRKLRSHGLLSWAGSCQRIGTTSRLRTTSTSCRRTTTTNDLAARSPHRKSSPPWQVQQMQQLPAELQLFGSILRGSRPGWSFLLIAPTKSGISAPSFARRPCEIYPVGNVNRPRHRHTAWPAQLRLRVLDAREADWLVSIQEP